MLPIFEYSNNCGVNEHDRYLCDYIFFLTVSIAAVLAAAPKFCLVSSSTSTAPVANTSRVMAYRADGGSCALSVNNSRFAIVPARKSSLVTVTK